MRANAVVGVQSVWFELDGELFATDGGAPFTIGGDSGGDYLPWTPTVGPHTLTATPYAGEAGTGEAGAPVTVHFNVVKSTVPPPAAFQAHVNFQPSGTAVPSGYVADTGSAYGARGNGLTYGWATAKTDAVDRNQSLSKDQRYDTLAFLQRPTTANQWELGVPNGTYQVHVVYRGPALLRRTWSA